MQTATPTENRLREIVARKLRIDSTDVSLDRALLGEIGLDSMDVLDVICEIEASFSSISIWGQPIAEKLNTLRDVATYIDGQLSGK